MQTSTSHQHVRHSHSHNHLAAAQRPQVYQVVASAPAVPHRTEHRHEHASSKPSKPVKVTHAPASQPVNLSDFAYSKCTGRKKALCIGINYTGTRQELRGCVNDAKNVMRFLHRNYGFKQEDIVILTDDRSDPRARPTKANMVDAMKWLVSGARPNDSLFFHYSGHGGQVKDRDGDEPDGKDEVIYPLDYRTAGPIIDDEMHAIMVRSLPRGCRLTALFDSCHSGSALDLPYSYHSDGRIKSMGVTDRARQRKHTAADVISWSGCKDSQTSADVASTDGRLAVGAMSDAFMASLSRNPRQSYAGLLKSVRDILKKKYSQKPQLSSSHKIVSSIACLRFHEAHSCSGYDSDVRYVTVCFLWEAREASLVLPDFRTCIKF
ncbi:hypothetical protein PUNSTDRAFT_74822 [Punctularia strigosozonata HHB-11173 SS5]|uniref:uncharacterized protein n=1 Tax=Punctularia strigosozonata (strain HHB-11173) TaxID=741275 RepID=UPI0004417EA8|nr:uncharacterized protein PUNSTDRAFT_74822 [Punctularia strigosozonata HHB-11173 SS5]EIN05383.1 hypothetical protein PUNSTDRAFT_74822 [Punctularia strigosozonata HHB-11173 SS5]